MNYEQLYTDLGYLFYSIAANDGKVSPAERAELIRIVQEQWLPLEGSRDELGTDEAHYIDIAFEHATNEHMAPDEAFARFEEHVRKFPGEFDVGLRRMIRSTALAVASATAARNKSELRRLVQLDLLFAKNPLP
ncbi:MAG: hypothetical protein IPL52_08030 [Flavobacteriales bacterium]|nr:hypothetical protein [Flavobacteriales bacterium]